MASKSSIKNISVQENNVVFILWVFFKSICVFTEYCIYSLFFLGKQIGKGSGLNELLNIHNSAKVVNVKDPVPGTWTIKVKLLQIQCMTYLRAYMRCLYNDLLHYLSQIFTDEFVVLR